MNKYNGLVLIIGQGLDNNRVKVEVNSSKKGLLITKDKG